MLNRQYLAELIDEVIKISPDDEDLYEINMEKRLEALTQNLDETIEYVDTCSEKELDWISEVFEPLSEYFKSQKLIDCVERNITRFDNSKLQEQLKMELKYMKMYL